MWESGSPAEKCWLVECNRHTRSNSKPINNGIDPITKSGNKLKNSLIFGNYVSDLKKVVINPQNITCSKQIIAKPEVQRVHVSDSKFHLHLYNFIV